VASGTAAYYSFDYGNIHFICLDSYRRSLQRGAMFMAHFFYDAALSTRIGRWLLASPSLHKGAHRWETELIRNERTLFPILEDAGVDIVLGGHSHS